MILFAVVRVRDLIVSIDYYGFCCKKIDIDHSVYQEWNVNYPGIPSFSPELQALNWVCTDKCFFSFFPSPLPFKVILPNPVLFISGFIIF